VVDDDPNNVELLSEVLRSCCQVRVATNGLRALAMIDSDDPPDLILLDVMMPGISGLEVCRTIQASPARRHIPVIFMSALGEPEDECRGLAVGAVDYFRKPMNPSVARARVRLHLDLKLARDALARRNEALETKLDERHAKRLERASQPAAVHHDHTVFPVRHDSDLHAIKPRGR
jgi:putative two-component system response regulator